MTKTTKTTKLTTLTLLTATLALPTSSPAWVAAHSGYHGTTVARGGFHGCAYHGGYHCGGVSTGTAVAAGVAGLAVGAMVGSAAAKASQPTVVVAAPPVYAAPYYYGAPPVVVPASAPVGGIYAVLPAGAQGATINGAQYYVLGATYFKPQFGNNGVYSEVVPNPI